MLTGEDLEAPQHFVEVANGDGILEVRRRGHERVQAAHRRIKRLVPRGAQRQEPHARARTDPERTSTSFCSSSALLCSAAASRMAHRPCEMDRWSVTFSFLNIMMYCGSSCGAVGRERRGGNDGPTHHRQLGLQRGLGDAVGHVAERLHDREAHLHAARQGKQQHDNATACLGLFSGEEPLGQDDVVRGGEVRLKARDRNLETPSHA